jgi:hypothetical protein
MSWLSDLQRLQPLEHDLALLPVGWGTGGKAPMLTGWQHHTGHTIAELQQWAGIRSVGARTGLLTGPLLAFDFDGESALELGLHPWAVTTWQIHRDNDPFRLKVLFRPTPEQIAQLPQQRDGSVEFQAKTHTAPGTANSKGEALEVFFDGGRQVILLGQHPSSGGNYIWPAELGPEALTAPPADWWQHALEQASTTAQRIRSGPARSTTRKGTTRLNPCPICGRHDGPGGSELWCEQTSDGLILCMPGSTFSAEQRWGPIRMGQVVDGWALVKRTPAESGEVLTFKQHQPKEKPDLRPRRPSRPCRPARRAA